MVLNAGVLVNYVRCWEKQLPLHHATNKIVNRRKEEVRRLQRNAVRTPDYVRLTCILMFDNGRSSKSISEDLSISIATVYRYVGDYQSGGIDNLLESHC